MKIYLACLSHFANYPKTPYNTFVIFDMSVEICKPVF